MRGSIRVKRRKRRHRKQKSFKKCKHLKTKYRRIYEEISKRVAGSTE